MSNDYDRIMWRKKFIATALKRTKPGSGSSIEFLNRRTWMNSVTDLNKLLQQTPFVIVGGVATRLYMVERRTLDVDILVLSSDAANAEQKLEQSGALPLGRLFQIGTLTCGGSSWQLPDGTKLDIIESSQTWANHAISHPKYSPNGLPVIDLPYKRVDEVRND